MKIVMPKGKKRKPDLRKIRTSKTYTLPEIAKALDRNIATVRSWVRIGLPLLSKQKPVLVQGFELKNWLQKTWHSKSQKCKPSELFCFKCRVPKQPKLGSIEIIPRNEKTVTIKGRCAACNTQMNQVGSMAKLAELEVLFNTQKPQMQRLSGYNNPSDRHTFRDQAGASK